MSNVKELLDEAIYAGNLSEKEEEKLYSWIKSLILAKRKVEEYEAKAKAWDNMKRDFEEISHTPMAQHILFNMSLIMEDVESGESE